MKPPGIARVEDGSGGTLLAVERAIFIWEGEARSRGSLIGAAPSNSLPIT
jgi:hypothetical protein